MKNFCLKSMILLSVSLLLSGCAGAPLGYGVQANSMKEWGQQQEEGLRKRSREFYKNTMSQFNYRERIYKSNFQETNLENVNYESVDYSDFKEEDNQFSGSVNGNLNKSTVKYKRSSLYTLMIADTLDHYHYQTKYVFGNTLLPEKFNDHNIGPYQIPGKAGDQNQAQYIENYLNRNQVAKQMVAKWFNRGRDGSFNMNLVAKRGEYNASELDIKIALHSVRGKAILKDAGEELIGNTFIVVYDFESINDVNKKWYKTNLNFVVRAYLYRLIWDDATAAVFYNDYWMDKNSLDSSRKTAFDNSDIFKLKYIGSIVMDENQNPEMFKQSEEQAKKEAKENGQLLVFDLQTKAALNVCINELQRKYEEFRTKFPLYSGDPIAAKVGKKEGIKAGDEFEVLEQVLNEDGTTEYHKMGTIKVAKKEDIWDNTAEGDWFGEYSKLEYTIFRGQKGKYHTGMLIRQIN